MQTVSNSDDVIDIRNIIERVEALEAVEFRRRDKDQHEELASLESLLAECCGKGGDEQWRGDWYPVTLIHDDYFRTYAEGLAEEIGAIPDNAQWPCTCIDWDKAARELRMNYTSVEFDGATYWTR